mmetsp:Transcript_27402/g.81623  ORF Transcript_27402/g.81623 Transcript_27402/m.81623 type:complete len:306 (-) Transcript_27402:56-973(-)
MPPTVLPAAEGVTTRSPDTSRTKREAPSEPAGLDPSGGVSVTDIEMPLFGVCSTLSPCLAATASSLRRKSGKEARRRSRRRSHPSAPRWSSVQKRSRTGEIEARPAYVDRTLASSSGPCRPSAVATIAPPTGTRKFLSVDCMKPSRRPWREALAMAFMQRSHCTPYALLQRWGTPCSAQRRATSRSLSTPRGAKHDVVVSTQSTSSAPISDSFAASASRSVRSSSPSSRFSIGTGVRPAALTALRHDFWSMRGQSTCRAFGRSWRSASSVSVTDMPVASGSVTHSETPAPPARRRASAASAFVSA